METFGACVVNDKGQLLPYTVQSTQSQCNEKAVELFADWDKLQKLGAKIVSVKIIAIEGTENQFKD